MADPRILPHVQPVPGFTSAECLALIESRFSNTGITDTSRRLALDGSNRQPKFIIPSVRDGLAAGVPVAGLALVSAAGCRYCCGTIEDGSVTPPNDPNWPALQARALAAKENPVTWLQMLHDMGAVATVAAYCG